VLFVLGTLAVLAFIVGVLLAIGRFYPGSSADLVDWVPTRSPEVEAQNEMRRRRGAPEITAEELHEGVAEDERLRLRGIGPFEAT